MADIKDENIERIEEKVDEPIEKKEEAKTFSQDEVNSMITKRLEREKKNAEIEKVEAEKLATMSEADRQQANLKIEKAKLADERKQFQREKLEVQVIKELSTKSLPTEFSKYLVGEDAETCITNIKEFETKWQQAMATAIDNKLRGKTPTSGGGQVAIINPWNTDSLNLTAQGKIYTENPELARQLMASKK